MGIESVRYADLKYMEGPIKNSAATTAGSISTMQGTERGTRWLHRTRIWPAFTPRSLYSIEKNHTFY